MKQFILKTVLAIICVCLTTGCKAQKIFSELSSDPDVESFYVGRAMMTLAKGAIKFSGEEDTDVAMSAIKGINSVEIINCDNSAAVDRIRAKARVILEKLKLEVIMENKEGETVSTFYGKTPEKSTENYIKNLVIENYEPGEYSLLHINGKIDFKAIMKEVEKEEKRELK